MKTTKFVALGLMACTVVALGAQTAQAVDSAVANSKGIVKFNVSGEEKPEIIDPTTPGPGTVTPPDEKEKPPVGDASLKIMYWPTFNFGVANYDKKNGNQLYAQPLTVMNNTTNQNATIPQFVQISSSVAQWNLEVEATDFINQGNKTETLGGAQIIFTNVTATKNTTATGTTAATAASLTSVNSVLPNGSAVQGLNISGGGATRIGQLTGGDANYTSINSFTFGTQSPTTADTYKAIMLEVPAGLTINDSNNAYISDLTWTLAEGV